MSGAFDPVALKAELAKLTPSQLQSLEERHAKDPSSLSDHEMQLVVFRDFLQTEAKIKSIEDAALKKSR